MEADKLKNLGKLWQRGVDFLGCKYAILAGAMSWVSEHNLVAAISNAGGFGVIAGGSMPPEILEQEILATTKLLNNESINFGINLITMHPLLDELVNVAIHNQVTHVILAGGLPKSSTIEKLKAAGIKVICFTPALILAKRLIRSGVDALIIEGSEAGGHIGPVSTSVLAQEILPHISEVPVFVAGGIGKGEAIVNYLMMGASGCQLGTRFVCATESIAHDNFKQAFIKSEARHATSSIQLDPDFPVIPVRAIENEATKDFINAQKDAIAQFRSGAITKEEAQLKIELYWAGALKRAVIDGDIVRGSLMAGQSVGMVKKIAPAQEIIDELVTEAGEYYTNILESMRVDA